MLESWSMKNLFIAISILSLSFSEVFGEVTSGSLTTSWSYDRTYEMITIRAYNSHSSKSLTVTKIKIWNNACSNISTSSAGDRTYAINKIVRPLSDRKITINAYLPRISGSRCSVISHDMVEPRVFKPVKPKPKSGAQKWLDKIRGN
jgi:hypothetical protein